MRQFIARCFPDKKGSIELTEKEKHYLISVLRLKIGNEVSVRLPNGSLCTMRVQFSAKGTKKEKNALLVAVAPLVNIEHNDTEHNLHSVPEYWLFQFLTKGQKMDTIVRQATECGVRAIIPIVGEYSIAGKKTEENTGKVERWMRIVREAQQQSGSSIDTKVFPPCSIENALSLWNESLHNDTKDGLAFVLCERDKNTKSVFSAVQQKETFENVRIGYAVGCEGGISPKELVLLEKHTFLPIHLKTNILRAETASVYSLAVLQTIVGEYNVWKGLNG